MKARTIVAIILATATAIIATVAFMQRKKKHSCCSPVDEPDCFADDCDNYCYDDSETESCCNSCACDADVCTEDEEEAVVNEQTDEADEAE